MRILFDGFWWRRGPVSNAQVMREFVLAWHRRFPEDELHVAVPHDDLSAVRDRIPPLIRLVGTRLRPQGVSAIVELPGIARRLGAEWTVTHNFTPLRGRSAVFVHDVMFVEHPEWFTRAERAYFALMPGTLRRARVVLTSSATEAGRIRSLLAGRGRADGRVEPIGLGLSRGLADAVAREPAGLGPLPDGALLAVGRLNVRKNLSRAIDAAVRSGAVSPGRPLLVVGEPQGRTAAEDPVVDAAVAAGSVRFLGFLDDAELAWLYERALVLVFLSLDEGFGMPTLEALHFGARVVASDLPVFREILGARARFVDPRDVDEAAAAIAGAVADGRGDREDVAALGYSWEASARRMRAALLKADEADAGDADPVRRRGAPLT